MATCRAQTLPWVGRSKGRSISGLRTQVRLLTCVFRAACPTRPCLSCWAPFVVLGPASEPHHTAGSVSVAPSASSAASTAAALWGLRLVLSLAGLQFCHLDMRNSYQELRETVVRHRCCEAPNMFRYSEVPRPRLPGPDLEYAMLNNAASCAATQTWSFRPKYAYFLTHRTITAVDRWVTVCSTPLRDARRLSGDSKGRCVHCISPPAIEQRLRFACSDHL